MLLAFIASTLSSYALLQSDVEHKRSFYGVITCFLAVFMFSAPLGSIVNIKMSFIFYFHYYFFYLSFVFILKKHVLMSRSTESLSIILCYANFFCASLWFIFGFLIGDKYVYVMFYYSDCY
jgi:hypothetical protein